MITCTRLLVAAAVCCLAAGAASPLMGQEPDASVRVQVNGDAIVARGDSQTILVVVRGDALVRGAVGTVVVVDGDLLIDSARVARVIAVRTDVRVGPGSAVTDRVRLVDAELSVDPSVQIAATVEEGWDLSHGAALFGLIAGLGFMVFVVVAGLVAAAVAPSLMREAGAAITENTGPMLIGSLVLWLAVPIASGLMLFTFIGAPTAVAILLALPLLWFLGYLVSGICLGDFILRRYRGGLEPVHPYRAAALGLVILLVAGWLPFFGSIVSLGAGVVGSGSLVLMGWRRFVAGWRQAPSRSPMSPPAAG